MPSNTVNASRMLFSAAAKNDIFDTERSVQQAGSPPEYYRAVAMEVFLDPWSLTPEDREVLKQNVTNPEFVDAMPANSILVRIVTGGTDISIPMPYVAYPFEGSHIMRPINAGEQVHVVYLDQEREGFKLPRWMSRIGENISVEDSNFTHGDRRFDPALIPAIKKTSQGQQQGTPPRPAFPNGGGTKETYSLLPSGSNNNPYDDIAKNSLAAKTFTPAISARWIKRSGDLSLQGGNNTLLSLQTDRTGPAARDDQNSKDRKENSGTIEIVAGRARFPLTEQDDVNTSEKPTSPLVSKNVRNNLEVDKTPFLRNKKKNPTEGNPDFKNDAARIYVSANTEGDTNFRTKRSTNVNEGIDYPTNVTAPVQPPQTAIGSSYVVSKADHLRLIARKQTIPSPQGGDINGSILLIKEGTKVNQDASQGDLAFLYISPEGTIQQEGRKLYLGQATQELQPYIRYSEFKKIIDKQQEEIDTLKSTLSSVINALVQSAAASVCAPFSPDPAWTQLAPKLFEKPATLEQSISQAKQEVEQSLQNSKSKKIFGE